MKKIYKIIYQDNGNIWDRIVSDDELLLFRTNIIKKIATEKEKFDYCIKEEFLKGKNYLSGVKLKGKDGENFGFYLSRYNRFYDRYLSEKLKIESLLSSKIRKQYGKGMGNEFKTGKFYSVASSSRFAVSSFSKKSKEGIIELIRKLEINGKIENIDIELEVCLDIEGMPNNTTPPQMDVVLKTKSGDTYFIEVKCHEIFDNSEHKKIKLKWKYLCADVFQELLDNNVKIKKKDEYISIDGNYLHAKDFNCKISTTHFDFKQFLCHLMGILSYKEKNKKEKIHFYYLFYKNENYIEIGNRKIYKELENELSEIFEKFGEKFPAIDFGYFYNNKFDTLNYLKKEGV